MKLQAAGMTDAELNARTAFVFGRLKDGVALPAITAFRCQYAMQFIAVLRE